MSVSLALVPVALALRLVMGKKNFDNWIASMQVMEPTNFQTELELVRTVRKAGYDAEKWMGVIKTHIDGEKLFFFWELINGQWTAVFGVNDSRQRIERFMMEISEFAGRQVFTLRSAQHNRSTSALSPAGKLPSTFPTNFRDGELLFRTLKEFGLNPQHKGADIVCKVEQSVLIFRQSGQSPFQVEIRNVPDWRRMYNYLSDMDHHYKQHVQEIVYQRLKERALLQNMTIESEERLEDNSIVVTLNIGS